MIGQYHHFRAGLVGDIPRELIVVVGFADDDLGALRFHQFDRVVHLLGRRSDRGLGLDRPDDVDVKGVGEILPRLVKGDDLESGVRLELFA